ncbi:MAG: hypothetical protein WCK10_02815, partial [Candidatus Staskawiczbacteria bacterium]
MKRKREDKYLVMLICVSVLFFVFVGVIGATPITTIGTISDASPGEISIPVTVKDFANIGAISLTLNYNISGMYYIGSTPNAAFVDFAVGEPVLGKITFSWFGFEGLSLGDNATLVTLSFIYVNGTSLLTWNYTLENACEYSDFPDFNVMNDTPKSDYYIDGSVSGEETIIPSIIYVNSTYSDGNSGGHTFGYDAFTAIQSGINAVASGGIVNVAAGTYTEIGQIVISKNLSIIGADKVTTIIKPNIDQSTAWFYVNAGITFNLSKVTLDGTVRVIKCGVKYKTTASGTVNDNIFTNIISTSTSGYA